jgi:hypothetical protein
MATITGVGFFDIAGGHAKGSALSGFELHPVIGFSCG